MLSQDSSKVVQTTATVPRMDDVLVKEELMPEVKVEIEPISVPIPWPTSLKEEPIENAEFASVYTNGERECGKHSEDKST